MEKELGGLGRGYWLIYLVVAAATAMVFTGHMTNEAWLNFIQIVVLGGVGVKEGGKALRDWRGRPTANDGKQP